MTKYKIPKGTFDIVPSYCEETDKWKHSHIWQFIENTIREIAHTYSYNEMRTPIFETTELFVRSSGETSDVVTKEMYTFEDKGKRSLTLCPEGTAPVMRAFMEKQLHMKRPCNKFFYISPMFRHERPQAGRYRQHHQFGVEAIGVCSPEQDAEVIDLLYSFYKKIGLKGLSVELNSLGTPDDRNNYRKELANYLHKFKDDLSEDSQTRLEFNPLRILDSKDPKDKELLQKAPQILDFLSDRSNTHFKTVKQMLSLLEVPFNINPKLVRGLDYYSETVFEITASDLGAQNSIGGGGRYDGLLKTLGGVDLPAVGFGSGLERVIQTLIAQGESEKIVPKQLDLFLIPMGEEALPKCMELIHKLRDRGFSCELDFTGKKLKKTLTLAYQFNPKFIGIIGSEELAKNSLQLTRTKDKFSQTLSLEIELLANTLLQDV